MTNTAVVILNYNGANYLQQFLPSVIAYSGDAQIIVADNKSTDNSLELLHHQFPGVTLIELDQNYGYAGGYNKALAQIDSTYVVLLNSDVEVTENWLSPLIGYLEVNPSYAACQPKVKDFNHRDLFEYAGAAGGYLDAFGFPYCRGRIFDTIEKDTGQYDLPADIFWATGACMVIKNDLFKEAGGLDPDFFAHMEEIDLCWRLHSIGYRIKAIPSSEVFHVGGGTLSKLSPRKTELNFRNGLYMLLKNLPWSGIIRKLPIRIALDWIAAMKFILEGNGKHGIAVWKAHLQVLINLGKTLRKRQRLSNALDHRVVVLDYYWRKRKKFDKLQ